MNLREALDREHSKRQTMRIVEYVGDDAERFAELIEIFFEDEFRYAQRAAWALNYCAQYHPELVKPYLEKLIDLLKEKQTHKAVPRNIARLLQFVEIPERLMGKAYSHCVDLFDDLAEPVAVRVFALEVATQIATREPALINELQMIVRKHLPHASAGIKARARKILAAKPK
jgi:hypothetical protein